MRKLLTVTLMVLVASQIFMGSAKSHIAAARVAGDEAKPDLAALLVLYKELGLPLPPRDAQLVRFEVGGGYSVNGGPFIPNKDELGFLLKPGSKTEQPTLLVGTSTWQLDPVVKPKWTVIQPTIKQIEDTDSGHARLLLAIQFQERGWSELAAKLIVNKEAGARGSAEEQVLRSAWGYWEGQLTQGGSDRKEIAGRLKDLIRREKTFDTRYHQALLKSLDLALVPGKGKPGSVEALIDNLVEYGVTSTRHAGFYQEEHCHRLAILGFEAVPSLIEHLDDDRLTRGMMLGFNNFRSFHLCVKHIVSDLLEGLAGQEVHFNWLRRLQGYTVPEEEVRAWWLRAQKEGEEAFLVRRFLDVDEPADGGRGARIREQRLSLLVAKYPKRIPEFYQTILEKNLSIETYSISQAMLASKVADADKIASCLKVLESKNLILHPPALAALSSLSSVDFAKALVQSIEACPSDTGEPYYSSAPACSIAELAARSNDPKVWEALAKVARRMKPGLRMEVLQRATSGDRADQNRPRKEMLGLLAQFLDDSDLSDSSLDQKIQLPGANYEYVKIEIRNGVATGMGEILGVDVGRDTERKPEHWAILRARVLEAWKREQSKGPAK
jgi:hypothetical protein